MTQWLIWYGYWNALQEKWQEPLHVWWKKDSFSLFPMNQSIDPSWSIQCRDHAQMGTTARSRSPTPYLDDHPTTCCNQCIYVQSCLVPKSPTNHRNLRIRIMYLGLIIWSPIWSARNACSIIFTHMLPKICSTTMHWCMLENTFTIIDVHVQAVRTRMVRKFTWTPQEI